MPSHLLPSARRCQEALARGMPRKRNINTHSECDIQIAQLKRERRRDTPANCSAFTNALGERGRRRLRARKLRIYKHARRQRFYGFEKSTRPSAGGCFILHSGKGSTKRP